MLGILDGETAHAAKAVRQSTVGYGGQIIVAPTGAVEVEMVDIIRFIVEVELFIGRRLEGDHRIQRSIDGAIGPLLENKQLSDVSLGDPDNGETGDGRRP